MEKQVLKKEEKKNSNGYILSIQYPHMPPVYSYVPFGSKLESIVSSALKSHPHAIILVQESTDL